MWNSYNPCWINKGWREVSITLVTPWWKADGEVRHIHNGNCKAIDERLVKLRIKRKQHRPAESTLATNCHKPMCVFHQICCKVHAFVHIRLHPCYNCNCIISCMYQIFCFRQCAIWQVQMFHAVSLCVALCRPLHCVTMCCALCSVLQHHVVSHGVCCMVMCSLSTCRVLLHFCICRVAWCYDMMCSVV